MRKLSSNFFLEIEETSVLANERKMGYHIEKESGGGVA